LNSLPELFRIGAHVFFAGLWQGAVLIAAVAIALRLCSRVGPQLRFAVWGVTFIVLLATPLVNLHTHSSPSDPLMPRVQLSVTWEYAIAMLWVILMAARAVQLAVHLSRVRATWKRATPIRADGNISKLLQRSSRSVELCTSADIDSPSVIGFWSPRLLVPEWLLPKLTPDDMGQIVLHELEHLRRRDDWLNLIQKIGLVLFPLNPALLWVDRKLAVERELACDACVVASTTQPVEYARCLARLAEHRSLYRKLALSLAAWTRQSELGRRVLSLLQPANTWSSRHAKFATVLLVLVLAGGGAEMARVPHFVTFADPHAVSAQNASVTAAYSQSAVPVVYRGTAQPQPKLLKAVMRPAHGPELSASAARAVRQQRLRKARTVKLRQQPRIPLALDAASVRGAANPSGGRLVQAVYMLPAEFTPSYVTIPFAGGWLIVQL
jgi:beta-lactamase regulating signal transducer with metallopeptidase domain